MTYFADVLNSLRSLATNTLECKITVGQSVLIICNEVVMKCFFKTYDYADETNIVFNEFGFCSFKVSVTRDRVLSIPTAKMVFQTNALQEISNRALPGNNTTV